MQPTRSQALPDFSERFTPQNLDGCPILELGARVWDPERYQAFKICYQTMRWVDNLVDDRKSSPLPLAEPEKARMRETISAWMLEQTSDNGGLSEELHRIRTRFALPAWPWQRWTKSMLYDLDHDGFPTLRAYLRYSEGAAVAPGAIFMHLCGLRAGSEGFAPPPFDVRRAARPLALFAYLVHIVRDFQKDHLQNLNYFTHDLMARHGLSRPALRGMAEGAPVLPGFRALVRDYQRLAEHYRQKTRQALDQVLPHLEPPYALSLEIIFDLYLQIFERIDPEAGNFTPQELVPTCPEVLARVQNTLRRFAAAP